jgi:hypothetical protein
LRRTRIADFFGRSSELEVCAGRSRSRGWGVWCRGRLVGQRRPQEWGSRRGAVRRGFKPGAAAGRWRVYCRPRPVDLPLSTSLPMSGVMAACGGGLGAARASKWGRRSTANIDDPSRGVPSVISKRARRGVQACERGRFGRSGPRRSPFGPPDGTRCGLQARRDIQGSTMKAVMTRPKTKVKCVLPVAACFGHGLKAGAQDELVRCVEG